MQDNFLTREKPSPSSDTALSKIDVHQNLKREKRKVVNDKLITPYIFELLVAKVYAEAADIYHITQGEIIDILTPKKICNKTIARVVNEVIPTAKATGNSIESLRRSRQKSNKTSSLVDELTKELEREMQGDI